MAPILETYGESMRRLAIHEFEHNCRYEMGKKSWTRPTLNVTQIDDVANGAPHLESLTLDVHRSGGKWPDGTLNTLSSFSELRSLTLSRLRRSLSHEIRQALPRQRRRKPVEALTNSLFQFHHFSIRS